MIGNFTTSGVGLGYGVNTTVVDGLWTGIYQNTANYPTPFSEKKPTYYEEWAKVFYNDMLNNIYRQQTIGVFIQNRAYSNGQQNMDKYFVRVSNRRNNGKDAAISNMIDNQRINVNRTPEKILSAKVQTICNHIKTSKRTPIIKANDPESLRIKAEKEYVIRGTNVLKQFYPDIYNSLTEPQSQEQAPQPLLPEELELKLNDIVTTQERAIHKVVDSTLYQFNDWQSTEGLLAVRLVEDGVAGVRYWVENGVVKFRVIDCVNLYFKIPLTQDFSDITAIGEGILMSGLDILSCNAKSEYPVPQEDIENAFVVQSQNPEAVSQFKFQVIDMEWKETTPMFFKKDNQGNLIIKGKGYNPEDSSKKVEIPVEVIYKAKWIVNTGVVFDYGIKDYTVRGDMSKNQYGKADFSFILFSPHINGSSDLNIVSMVNRVIPNIDNYEIAKMNIMLEYASYNPSMTAYSNELIEHMMRTFKTQNPTDIFMFTQNMRTIIDAPLTEEDRLQGTAKRDPVRKIESTLDTTAIQTWMNEMIIAKNAIDELMGVPKGLDGTLPATNQPVRTTEMAAQSGNIALNDYRNAIGSIFTRLCKSITKCAQQIIAEVENGTREYTPYFEMIDSMEEQSMATLRFVNTDFAYSYTQAPSFEEIQKIEADLSLALQAGVITVSDKAEILLIAKDNYPYAIKLLKAKEARNQKMAQDNQLALAQEQNKATLDAAKMGVDGRINELNEEYRLKKELSAQEHNQKLAEIKAQNAGIATKAQIDKDAKTTVADTNERAASQKSLLDYDAKIEASKQKTATT